MKRVGGRAAALIVLAVVILGGMSLYILRFLTNGREWVSFASNKTVYSGGVLKVGTILDRDGQVLSQVISGSRDYADDELVRKATLHVLGDPGGNIGTGALSVFAPRLMGYNALTGAYSRTGNGKTLSLTIDADVCAAAYKALGGSRGAVGVVNYKTGQILCMVSSPSFDPMNIPDLTGEKYEGVYLNRFLSATYPPGSVFKLVTLAAAVENIPDLNDRVFHCDGGITVGGDFVACTKKHGDLSIEDALAVSCNSAFGELALELGAGTLADYAARFGLTESFEIDGIKTAAGSFKSAAPNTSSLAWSGIGQYEDMVCPAAVLRFVSAVANGGNAVDMTLIKDKGPASLLPPGSSRLLGKQTAERLATMMNYNVYKTYGKDNYPGLELYAKTGTAEVGGGKQPHAWFAGFITNKDAPMAFVVIVENGGSGSRTAGAVANKVLQAAVKENE
jgi:cell division protein FtsI/penicillin-binding protein 2